MQPFISIIVPVYQVRDKLHRCVDSLLAQSYNNFELLLIDDGSHDGSGMICDDYSAKDSRVRAYHKSNGGVSTARNLGLDEAKGDWVCFVDSDDWVDNNYLENFIVRIDNESDIILQSFWIESGNCQVDVILPNRTIENNFELIEFLEKGASQNKGYHNGFLWHRLFRRSTIENNKIRFITGISFAEDAIFFFNAIKSARGFPLTSRQGYHYVVNVGSLTTRGGKLPVEKHLKTLRLLLEVLNDITVIPNKQANYIKFVKLYIWRLLSNWIIFKMDFNDEVILNQICSKINYFVERNHLEVSFGASAYFSILYKSLRIHNNRTKSNVIRTLLLADRVLKKVRSTI